MAAIKTCKFCGLSGLSWTQIGGKFRLKHPDGSLHKCIGSPDPVSPTYATMKATTDALMAAKLADMDDPGDAAEAYAAKVKMKARAYPAEKPVYINVPPSLEDLAYSLDEEEQKLDMSEPPEPEGPSILETLLAEL